MRQSRHCQCVYRCETVTSVCVSLWDNHVSVCTAVRQSRRCVYRCDWEVPGYASLVLAATNSSAPAYRASQTLRHQHYVTNTTSQTLRQSPAYRASPTLRHLPTGPHQHYVTCLPGLINTTSITCLPGLTNITPPAYWASPTDTASPAYWASPTLCHQHRLRHWLAYRTSPTLRHVTRSPWRLEA